MDTDQKPTGLPAGAQKVFTGEIFTIWQWPQKIYDGSIQTFEKAQRPDTVFVLPVLPDGKILLVTDEQPHRQPILTLPAGRMEVGEDDPLAAMKRELLEETGYEAGRWIPWYSYQPVGKILWQVHGYIARDLRQVRMADPGEGERITPEPHSFEEFIAAVRGDKMHDFALKAYILEALLDEQHMKEFKNLLYG